MRKRNITKKGATKKDTDAARTSDRPGKLKTPKHPVGKKHTAPAKSQTIRDGVLEAAIEFLEEHLSLYLDEGSHYIYVSSDGTIFSLSAQKGNWFVDVEGEKITCIEGNPEYLNNPEYRGDPGEDNDPNEYEVFPWDYVMEQSELWDMRDIGDAIDNIPFGFFDDEEEVIHV